MQGLATLVTRPFPDAERTGAALGAIGFSPVFAPMLEMAVMDVQLPDPKGFCAVMASSANGIRALGMLEGGRDFAALPLFAIGTATAEAGRELGFETITIADGGTFADLVAALKAARPGGPVFYPAPIHRSGDIAGVTLSEGAYLKTLAVYEMVAAQNLSDDVAGRLAEGDIGSAVFFSRRTAAIFCALTADPRFGRARARLDCLCLSQTVAGPLRESGFTRTLVADYPTHEAMISLAAGFARAQISP